MKIGVTVVPISGLGNRMRVVTSVVQFALQTQTQVRIAWQPAWDCQARFDELFEPLQASCVTMEKGSLMDTPATKDNLFLPYLMRLFKFSHEERCFRPSSDMAFASLLEKYPSMYVNTCYALSPYPSAMVSQVFVPLPFIKERIDDVVSNFTKNTLGVHIRRSDNRKAILHSPLTLFRERIDAMLERGKADRIFLCTDDDNVRDFLRKRYGGRLISRNIELRRDKYQGIKDAVIDLWSLSQTKHILGSYYSSFSDTAAELGNVPFEIVSK